MRHLVKTKKLGRNTSHRLALLRNMATSLFESGQIQTTLGKAKALRPFAEKLITIAKTDNKITAIRRLSSVLYTKSAVEKCFKAADAAKARQGGYCRVIKSGFRYGDAAPTGVIQLVDRP